MKNVSEISVKVNFENALSKLNFSKRAVAIKSGMPSGSLSSMLNSDNPTTQQLYKLSKGIGVSISYLLMGGDVEKELNRSYNLAPLKRPKLKKSWDPRKPNVAARIQMVLKTKGITKFKAAKIINVIPSWWSPILKRNNPTVTVLRRIAFALGVSPNKLVAPVTPDEYYSVVAPKINF